MNILRKILPKKLISFYHFLLSLLGVIVYRYPSKRIKVIGITGTKGKTTTSNFLSSILSEAGMKTALSSSTKFKIGDKEWKNNLKMTMPGRLKIQKLLRKAVNEGCTHFVLEVTSEGIKQYRHSFISFDIAVFTNLSPEHIDSHGSFENYREAKGKLFQKTKDLHIINGKDENADFFLNIESREKIIFNKGKFEPSEIKEEKEGISFNLQGVPFNLPLIGSFNIDNAVTSSVVALSLGVPLETSSNVLKKIKTEGRMEIVSREPFVVVDYAHTPQSLEEVYKSLLRIKEESGELISVLGSCGGGRDKWKRPVFGRIAKEYCKRIIITNEDPYDEDPEKIIDEVLEGTEGKGEKIIDRREAIFSAIKDAKKEDIVIITGKGQEGWICIEKGKKIPWNDKDIVLEIIKEL